jgi:hypothetical protein
MVYGVEAKTAEPAPQPPKADAPPSADPWHGAAYAADPWAAYLGSRVPQPPRATQRGRTHPRLGPRTRPPSTAARSTPSGKARARARTLDHGRLSSVITALVVVTRSDYARHHPGWVASLAPRVARIAKAEGTA